MQRQTLRVLSEQEAATRGILEPDSSDPNFLYFSGGGPVDLHCGGCSRRLAKKVAVGFEQTMVNAALRCSGCGAVNALGAAMPQG